MSSAKFQWAQGVVALSLFASAPVVHSEKISGEAIRHAVATRQPYLFVNNGEDPFFQHAAGKKLHALKAQGAVAPAPVRHVVFTQNEAGRGVAVTFGERPSPKGDGEVVTQDYPLRSGVETVVINTPANVAIVVGPVAKVSVRADRNLQAMLAPRQKAGVLEVLAEDAAFQTEHLPEVIVTLPEFGKLVAFNGADVWLDDFKLERLHVLAGNGTRVHGRGHYLSVVANASGKANVDLRHAEIRRADFVVLSQARMSAAVTAELSVVVSDRATAEIQGHPHIVSSTCEPGSTLDLP